MKQVHGSRLFSNTAISPLLQSAQKGQREKNISTDATFNYKSPQSIKYSTKFFLFFHAYWHFPSSAKCETGLLFIRPEENAMEFCTDLRKALTKIKLFLLHTIQYKITNAYLIIRFEH